MPHIQFHLIPTPGAKPEILATVNTSATSLPSKVVLEGYTREAWAWKPHAAWTSAEVTPVDTKSQQKLDGFLKYLKERQKCAYGRFSPTAVVAFSYIQSSNNNNTTMLRFTHDATQIPNCSIVKRNPTQPLVQSQPFVQHQQQPTTTTTTATAASTTTQKKAGMLGNLLGAQKRTDEHMNVTIQKKQRAMEQNANDNGVSSKKTAQQVLQDFRHAMEQKMLDFDLDEDENCLKVRIELAKICACLQGEEKTLITMDVLKYIVYEQAEEVNEEWVAAKEPSEFMDDVVIAVYKEAPPEILDQVNQVEVTEEVKGASRAISEARRKIAVRNDYKLQHQAVEAQDEDLATLNVKKRDRRTIEEIQRDLDPKRARIT